MSAAIVCGFSDPDAGLAGLGWELAPSRGGLLLAGGELIRAEAEIEQAKKATTLRLRAGERTIEAELRPSPAPSQLSSAAAANGSGVESAACAASVRSNGARVKCRGHLTTWGSDPTAGAGVLRHLALPAADDALLLVISSAEPGAEWHGDERASAWLLDPEGGAGDYPEALLSTQYDERGRPTRAGLELWSADEHAPPMRAAGAQVAAAPEPAGGVSATILRTSAEGTGGLGSYLIWRA